MDSLPAYGRNIAEAVLPTFQSYAPLLIAQSTAINSTAKKTYRYGSLPRQSLDVYYPSQNVVPELQDKLIIFLYGGGFAQGDKTLESLPLVYANVGHFFAGEHGVETIVMDYRLLSHGARFPSGGEDLQVAMDWVQGHYQGKSITLLGTSAGAIHLSTYLLGTGFKVSRDRLLQGSNNKLVGAVLANMPIGFEGADRTTLQAAKSYFGDEDGKHAIALLQQAKLKGDFSLPHILVLNSELDPDFVKAYNKTLMEELEGLNASSVECKEIKGHNHFSPLLALGTGIDKEEDWGHQLISWVSSKI
ncbi:hypothetical protein FOQG_09661 [Fusarium oxysporum f. sp. raphani 54005]|uniref:BD-FAE-like domain-containing protein n=2 Tax=Fusarium oxysporum f. sp. raphani TaxID=96318 RepID=X0C6F0_FUSOX|nr:hypothetical protein FOQG_09661 [Fusarium oxysporum f. sp. raphani 54005]KAG7427765.1 Cholinesterase [Fusarium oxysporum f. sp. raphani]